MPGEWVQKCKARRKDGEPCGRWAIKGGTVCPKHGGQAPQVRAAADRRMALRHATLEAVARGGPEAIVDNRHPVEHLLDELRWSAALVAVLGMRVADQEGSEDSPTYRAWERERDRHAKLAKLGLDAGIDERRVAVMETQALGLATALRNTLERLDLTPAQRDQALGVLRGELLALKEGAA